MSDYFEGSEDCPEFWGEIDCVECICGARMFPNVSTWDSEGCGWSCLNPDCGDYSAGEIDSDDLRAVGVPAWVAELLGTYFDTLND